MEATQPSAVSQAPQSEDRKAARQCRTTGCSRSLHTIKEAKKLGCSVPYATVIPTAVRKVLTSAQTLEWANEPKNPRIDFLR